MAPYLGQKAGPDSRELVRSLVEARLSILTDDAYMFGTIGDKPSKPSSVGTHITSRISNFVNSDAAKGAIHSAASKAFTSVQHHHKAIIASALIYSVQHAAHIDVAPGDVEEHLHHQIEHLGTNLKISKDMAHGVLTHAVGKLKELRGIKEAIEKDDELDAAITRLHKILKKIEPHYREPAKDQPQDQIKKVPPPKEAMEPTSPDRIKDIETKFEPHIKKWILDRIDQHQAKRNWSSLPSDYEHDAVKFLHKDIKDHFPKKAVALKVNAGKATTFNDLRNHVMKVNVR